MEAKVCQLCGTLASVTYVCHLCKREVCDVCFKHEVGVCSECYRRLEYGKPLLTVPMKLFLLGFVLIFLGMIFLMASSVLSGDVQTTTGIVIFIGPIPIMLGTGPYSIFAVLLAAILTVLGVVFFFLMRK